MKTGFFVGKKIVPVAYMKLSESTLPLLKNIARKFLLTFIDFIG